MINSAKSGNEREASPGFRFAPSGLVHHCEIWVPDAAEQKDAAPVAWSSQIPEPCAKQKTYPTRLKKTTA